MLISASIPKALLGEEALTAIYSINHVLSFILEDQSPFEHLYDRPPTYNLFKVYSFAYFFHLQPHEHTDLEPALTFVAFLVVVQNIKGISVL